MPSEIGRVRRRPTAAMSTCHQRLHVPSGSRPATFGPGPGGVTCTFTASSAITRISVSADSSRHPYRRLTSGTEDVVHPHREYEERPQRAAVVAHLVHVLAHEPLDRV